MSKPALPGGRSSANTRSNDAIHHRHPHVRTAAPPHPTSCGGKTAIPEKRTLNISERLESTFD
jgi:hypothetical protein